MMRFLGFLAFLAIFVGAWGWFANWFTFSSSSEDGTHHFTLDVHADELARDLDVYEEKVRRFVEVVDREIDALRDRHRAASAKTRPELERRIEQEEQKKVEAQDALQDMKQADASELPAKTQKLDHVLDEEPAAGKPAASVDDRRIPQMKAAPPKKPAKGEKRRDG